MKCENCESVFTKSENPDYLKFDLCDECKKNYDGDKTGYCSLSCCMGNGCDGSC